MISIETGAILGLAGNRCNECREESDELTGFNIVRNVIVLCPCCKRKLLNVVRSTINDGGM